MKVLDAIGAYTYIRGMVDKMLQVRASPKLVRAIDEWRIRQGLPVLSRAEAVRKLILSVLKEDEEC